MWADLGAQKRQFGLEPFLSLLFAVFVLRHHIAQQTIACADRKGEQGRKCMLELDVEMAGANIGRHDLLQNDENSRQAQQGN